MEFPDQNGFVCCSIASLHTIDIAIAGSIELRVTLNAQLDATLEGWARALELRDVETRGHSERVTQITVRLAQKVGMTEEELNAARRGALLHDIGKMGVPDGILLKPGLLTEDEWEVMRRHPIYAYEMLAPIGYLGSVLDIPYSHHEKWDGSGYPQGLKGEQIPLAARIFSVADVWDSLGSARPYKQPWPQERAREYILDQAGAHFDPSEVDVFLTTEGGAERPHSDELTAANIQLEHKVSQRIWTDELRRSQQRIVAAQESVRKGIAQELHASVQSKLVLLEYHLRTMQSKADGCSEELAALVMDRTQELRQVQDDLRRVVQQLYPSTVRLGLVAALRSLRDRFEAAVPLDLLLDEALERGEQQDGNLLPEGIRLTAYRIAEEALTNVVKHAKASRATVRLELSPEGVLRLLVRDDGQGFDVEQPPMEMGLLNMQDLAEAAAGRYVIQSSPGKGTEVALILPLAGPGAGNRG